MLVTLEDIVNGDANIQELCGKADKWLPSQLPGNADYVNLTQLTLSSYTDEIFDALIAEMKSSAAKLDEVTDMIWTDYREDLADALGVPTGEQYEEVFKEAFRQAVRITDQRVLAEVKSQFSGYLTEDLSVEPIDYNIGRVDISDDVVDMLADNLDPEGSGSSKNSLYLAGEIFSKLPISLSLEPELKSVPEDGSPATTILKFDVGVDATKETQRDQGLRGYPALCRESAAVAQQCRDHYSGDAREILSGQRFRNGPHSRGQRETADRNQTVSHKNGGLKLDI